MNTYPPQSGSSVGTSLIGSAPEFMPLQARLEQLEAAVRAALESTNGITYYPTEDVPPADSNPRNEGMIGTVDVLNILMFQLNARLTRIREVTGGAI